MQANIILHQANRLCAFTYLQMNCNYRGKDETEGISPALALVSCSICLSHLVAEVQLIRMVDQSAPKAQAQLTFQKPDGTVNESCRNCNKQPLGELQHEGLRILLDDTLYYQT